MPEAPWTVRVSYSEGVGYHVAPTNDPFMHVAHWGGYRYEWPSHKRLPRSVAKCQAWCDRQNAEDAVGRATVRGYESASVEAACKSCAENLAVGRTPLLVDATLAELNALDAQPGGPIREVCLHVPGMWTAWPNP